MPRGEDVGSGCRAGLKAHVAGFAPAPQCLPASRLARSWGDRGLQDRQLDRLGQDGTVGSERVVLQVAARAHINLLGGLR